MFRGRVRRIRIGFAIVGLLVLGIVVRGPVQRAAVTVIEALEGKKTVSQRLEEYGGAVGKRLEPYFKASGVAYPPRKVVFVGLKLEKILEVWACGDSGGFRLIRRYPILGASRGGQL